MKNFIITKCLLSDAVAMLHLEKTCFEDAYTLEMFDEMLSDTQTINIKAESTNPNAVLIGYVSIQIVLNEANLTSIAVDSDYRGNGIGEKLLKEAIKEVKNRGVNYIFLEVNYKNAVAINLYLKLGFKQISIRQKYYGEDSALIMRLQL